jgi:hypothetical protein
MKRILLHPSKVVLVLVALIIGVSVAAVFARAPTISGDHPSVVPAEPRGRALDLSRASGTRMSGSQSV